MLGGPGGPGEPGLPGGPGVLGGPGGPDGPGGPGLKVAIGEIVEGVVNPKSKVLINSLAFSCVVG